ncbi:hypothetical protein NQ314_008594 [Rhamnusium bicolor]|uniref:C2H2-type domain-containing protein n=1 Tax=Rhamnusium bicolor TaxID=1586634 RepID=A0AAV8Y7R0_9CUCU|nr:hypothetical protein NQ314_008594 [Rhamnusium bicolor]
MGDLRKMGNFKFNKARKETDEIFLARKPYNKDVDVSKYTPCQKCKVFITKASLRRHYRSCEPNRKGHKDRNVMIGSRAILGKIHPLANEVLKLKVFPVLKEDTIKEIIRYDELLILYGNTMCDKYRDQHHFDMIRSRLRMMARFLSIIKLLDTSINDFKSVFKPEYFQLITQALHKIGEYNENTGHFMKPTLPSTVGTALKYIGKLYISCCIKYKDESTKKEVEDLMVLLRTDLESTVNKTSIESLLRQKRQKKVILPDTKDIKNLNDYLLKNRNHYFDDLVKRDFSYKSWLELSKFTLLSVLVFNRKRPGELERAHVIDYKNMQKN